MTKSLAEMTEEVYATEVQLGWQPNDNRFGESMALLHSEVSEALEAYRSHGFEDVTGPRHRVNCLGNYHPCDCPPAKPEGIASEFADILIRLLSSAHQWGVDLEAEYERKTVYNRTRTHRHGGKLL